VAEARFHFGHVQQVVDELQESMELAKEFIKIQKKGVTR
jgi:hypothetical protein